MDLEVPKHVTSTFDPQKLDPLVQKFKFAQFELHAFAQNFPTCTGHNSLNFHLLKVIFDFLEISKYPLQSIC